MRLWCLVLSPPWQWSVISVVVVLSLGLLLALLVVQIALSVRLTRGVSRFPRCRPRVVVWWSPPVVSRLRVWALVQCVLPIHLCLITLVIMVVVARLVKWWPSCLQRLLEDSLRLVSSLTVWVWVPVVLADPLVLLSR